MSFHFQERDLYFFFSVINVLIRDHFNIIFCLNYTCNTLLKYVLKRVSFGSKDCTKELKLECAYFLGQTS